MHPAIVAAMLLGLAYGNASAASNTVYRCAGANGQVTLSDRRCLEDDPQAKAKTETPQAAASAASTAEGKLDAKACGELKDKLAEKRKLPPANDADRKAARLLEDEQRRRCGA